MHALGVDVADDAARAVRPDLGIDADVDDGRTGLHHIGLDQPRLADRDEQRVGAARMRGHRARHVMADRHRRAFAHQQEGDRLADDLGMADDDDFQPLEVETGLLQQFDRGRRRAGREIELVVDDVADRGRMHALDILQRMHRRLQRLDRDMRRHRPLDDDAGDARIGVQPMDRRFQFAGVMSAGKRRSSKSMPASAALARWLRT